jgi:hypothetical protein
LKQLVFFRSDAVRVACSTKCLGRFAGRWRGGVLERYVPVAELPLVSTGSGWRGFSSPVRARDLFFFEKPERVILVNLSGHLALDGRKLEMISCSRFHHRFQLMLFSFLWDIVPVQ